MRFLTWLLVDVFGAAVCKARGHDWVTYPPHMIPASERESGTAGALFCMRCWRLEPQRVPHAGGYR